MPNAIFIYAWSWLVILAPALSAEPAPPRSTAEAKLQQVEKTLQVMADFCLDRQKNEYESRENQTVQSVVKRLDLKDGQETKIKEALQAEHQKLNDTWRAAYCKEHRQAVQKAIEAEGGTYIRKVDRSEEWCSTDQADALVEAASKKVLPEVLKQQLGEQHYAEWLNKQKAQAQFAIHGFSLMLVSELDAALNLLPTQRDKLESVVIERLRQLPELRESTTLLNHCYSNEDFLRLTPALPRVRMIQCLDAKQRDKLDELYSEHEAEWENLKKQLRQ